MFRDIVELVKQQPVASSFLAFILVATVWLAINAVSVFFNSQSKEDCVLVLGGSVGRELYAAVLAKHYPDNFTIVSGGEQPPCSRVIFEKAGAPLDKVILERSARSTFENFTFSIPILKRLHAKRVGVITSLGNEQRGMWMARIFLWANGIAVDNKIIPGEYSQGGHEEEPLKTALDVLRSIAWAPVTNIFAPPGEQINLNEVVVPKTMDCHPVPDGLQQEYEKSLQ